MADAAVPRLPPNVKDISGLRSFRLTARSFVHGGHGAFWEFVCDCGTYKTLRAAEVKAGKVRSCGCLNAEKVRSPKPSLRTHGMVGSKLYGCYCSMISRCHRKTDQVYFSYGARGIAVCEEWRIDRSLFFRWALENGYGAGLELDRRDNNGNYSPENCRWVTRQVNCNNRRSNVPLASQGKVMNIAEWAREIGVSATVVRRAAINGRCLRGHTLVRV